MIALLLVLSAGPDHIAAARIAGVTYQIEPELLLAIAEHETTWRAELVNGRACGPMQVVPTDERRRYQPGRCAAMAIPLIGYLEGARELRIRLGYARGDLRAALRLYGCGWEKNADGDPIPVIPPTCRGFDGWVIAHRDAYRREAQS